MCWYAPGTALLFSWGFLFKFCSKAIKGVDGLLLMASSLFNLVWFKSIICSKFDEFVVESLEDPTMELDTLSELKIYYTWKYLKISNKSNRSIFKTSVKNKSTVTPNA